MFIIFINDLDDGVVNKIVKFADDTKIRYYNRIYTRCSIGRRTGKCCSTRIKVVMHFGFNNKEVDYVLGTQRLHAIEEERDLGVIVDKSL